MVSNGHKGSIIFVFFWILVKHCATNFDRRSVFGSALNASYKNKETLELLTVRLVLGVLCKKGDK